MSVTITFTDSQRTSLLLALGLARGSAEIYELYATKPAKPYWATYRDEATELFEIVNEARRDSDPTLVTASAIFRCGDPTCSICGVPPW